MDDHAAQALDLLADFPRVSAAEWEALILQDLKGAPYDKRLIWRTEDDIGVRPYYRREHLDQLGIDPDLAPGQFPYRRGPGRTWQEQEEFSAPENSIRADQYHEAGATTVQELAFGLAEAVDRLAADIERGTTASNAAQGTVFVFAVGSNYFLEIAKLRAARLLWSTAVSAFEISDEGPALCQIYARTSRLNKSLLDPYTNLIRVTTEAMSAVIGGCDTLHVEPFGFDAQLALSVHRLLREEAQLGRVLDVAGGSYYVEVLTDLLANQAWALFQTIEQGGGWTEAIKSGFAAEQLKVSRDAKSHDVAVR
ncbi:MAG TPA: methylmalonyl-CoA mutase family protein, partial [Bryobacteraceae bacterium]|nr:methylmalonyl-CoA mutase family protein [Bryobacteraceae bacterium]